MRLILGTLLACLITIAGCSPGSQRVVGQTMPLSSSDSQELSEAKEVARVYVEAWFNRDYGRMYSLQSGRTTGSYDTFRRLSSAWRTKGFSRGTGVLDQDTRGQAVSSIELVTGISNPFVQRYVSACVHGKEAMDEVQSGRWPEKVLLLRLVIADKPCALFMGRDNGRWLVLNQPGTVEDAWPQFWDEVKRERRHVSPAPKPSVRPD